ncbi:MAG TPA: peptide chain release factor 3, partial [Gemmatimonadaceae bacterium]|nr:peptide chain release factor 3 [Gemmatimonadaceae bacterium]
AVEEAWPGDVVGVIDRGNLRIGDTLSEASDVEFAEIPRFAPEMFARLVLADPMKRKQLDTGLRQLTEEGAAQVFFVEGSTSAPVIGAVGQLQFDVMLHRLEHEYGAPCKLERFGYKYPRWVHGPEAAIRRVAASANGVALLRDAKEHPVFVFADAFAVRWVTERETGGLRFETTAP